MEKKKKAELWEKAKSGPGKRYKTKEDYMEARLSGLHYMSDKCQGMTVLELGCAEGMISKTFADYNISLIHGVDKHDVRVKEARSISDNYIKNLGIDYKFVADDFRNIKEFLNRNSNWLIESYDILLLLGVFHNVESKNFDETFLPLLDRTHKYVLCRGRTFEHKGFVSWAKKNGLKLVSTTSPPANSRGVQNGSLFVFEKGH